MLIICLRPLAGSFPASFVQTQEDSDFITLYPNGREERDLFFHARLMASSGSVGAYVVRSYTQEGDTMLSSFASASSRAWTFQELRSDNTTLATRLKAAWRDERSEADISGSVDKVSLLRSMFL